MTLLPLWMALLVPPRMRAGPQAIKYLFTVLHRSHERAFIFIQDNQALGIGSGSTIVFAVERIGELLLVPAINLFSKKLKVSTCIL